MEPAVIAMLGGVLPFGSIFIEMYVCLNIYIQQCVLIVSCVNLFKTKLVFVCAALITAEQCKTCLRMEPETKSEV